MPKLIPLQKHHDIYNTPLSCSKLLLRYGRQFYVEHTLGTRGLGYARRDWVLRLENSAMLIGKWSHHPTQDEVEQTIVWWTLANRTEKWIR